MNYELLPEALARISPAPSPPLGRSPSHANSQWLSEGQPRSKALNSDLPGTVRLRTDDVNWWDDWCDDRSDDVVDLCYDALFAMSEQAGSTCFVSYEKPLLRLGTSRFAQLGLWLEPRSSCVVIGCEVSEPAIWEKLLKQVGLQHRFSATPNTLEIVVTLESYLSTLPLFEALCREALLRALQAE